jgi:hypothetical protein
MGCLGIEEITAIKWISREQMWGRGAGTTGLFLGSYEHSNGTRVP